MPMSTLPDYSTYFSSHCTTAALPTFTSIRYPETYKSVNHPSTLDIMKTMKDDIKNFIIENRTLIYWLMILLILDQWIFQGRFREKLHELFEALIDKVKKMFDLHEAPRP